MPVVVAINWVEHERGWGSRPSGHTLHPSLAAAEAYVAGVRAASDPNEYSSPGIPFPVDVTDDLYAKVAAAEPYWGHVSSHLSRSCGVLS